MKGIYGSKCRKVNDSGSRFPTKYGLNERKGQIAAVNEWSKIQRMSMNVQEKGHKRLAGSNILNVNLVPSIEFRMISQS